MTTTAIIDEAVVEMAGRASKALRIAIEALDQSLEAGDPSETLSRSQRSGRYTTRWATTRR